MLDYNNTKIRIRDQNHLMKVLKILEYNGYDYAPSIMEIMINHKAEALYIYSKNSIGWNASYWKESEKLTIWNRSRFKEVFIENKKINRRIIITTKEINL